MSEICAKCSSDKIIPKARIIDKGDSNIASNLQVIIDENPDALLFKGRISSSLFAKICGNCGFTEVYAQDHQALYTAYKNQIKKQIEINPIYPSDL